MGSSSNQGIAILAKITSGIFAIIAKFRYGSENMYGPPLTNKTVHSEVSKTKKGY